MCKINTNTPDDAVYLNVPVGGNGGLHQLPDYITVRILTENNIQQFYRINRKAKFNKILEAFCRHTSINVAGVFFKFDGEYVEGNSTPLSLNVMNGDTIEVWKYTSIFH